MKIAKSVNRIKKTRGVLYLKTLFIIAGILTVGGVLLYFYIAKGSNIKKQPEAITANENNKAKPSPTIITPTQVPTNKPSPTITTPTQVPTNKPSPTITTPTQVPTNKPSPTITTPTQVPTNKPSPVITTPPQEPNNARIVFLHHSTGGRIWDGGVPQLIKEYNENNEKNYQISEQTYPSTKGGYPWSNYPYDYYNLWVKHTGDFQDRKELNLDQIAANYDVIIFKHCFPVSEIKANTGKPDINSNRKSLENYKLQYTALRDRMLQFPDKKFIVWTGAALSEDSTTPEQAERSKEWVDWVKNEWDKTGDNIFIFDFEQLETEGCLYLKYPSRNKDSHPDINFSKTAASEFVKKIIEVIQAPIV